MSSQKTPPEFDYYTISRVLGEGGMGVVYLAHDRRTGLPVAIKVMSKRVFDPALQARFLKENRILSALNHRNIVRCFEITQSKGGTPSIVMEYVDGVDVRAFEGRPYPELLPLMIQALMGLTYLRSRNVLHRDLSSNNIFVTLENRKRLTKILDFGVAKLLQEQETDADVKTQTGQFLGKFAFASPELFVASDVDWRSDVFSLGVIFHRLLTKTPPIRVARGSNYFEWLMAHQAERNYEVEAPAGVPPLPKELADVVRRMLARKPEDRPQSYEEIIDALHQVQLGVPAGLEPDPSVLETLPQPVAEPLGSSGGGGTARTPTPQPVSKEVPAISSSRPEPAEEPVPPAADSQQKRWPDLERTIDRAAPEPAPASETFISPPARPSSAPDITSDKTERFDDVLAKLRQEAALHPPPSPAPPTSPPPSPRPDVQPSPTFAPEASPPAPIPEAPRLEPPRPADAGERKAAPPAPAGRRLVIYGEPAPPPAAPPRPVPPSVASPAPVSPPDAGIRSRRWLGIGLIVAAIVIVFLAVLLGLIALLRGASQGTAPRSSLSEPVPAAVAAAFPYPDPNSA